MYLCQNLESFDIMIRKSFIFRSREIEFKFLSFNFSVVHMIDLVVLAKNQTLTQSCIVLAPLSYAKAPTMIRIVMIPMEKGINGILVLCEDTSGDEEKSEDSG